MPDVQVLYAEDISGAITANSTTWVDVCSVAAASFTASKKYLIIANQVTSNSNAAAEGRIRLVHGLTPTVFDDASLAFESGTGAEHGLHYMFFYTQPGTTELVKLQISSSSTNVTTSVFGQIIPINLDDYGTDSVDFFQAEDLLDYTMTATPTAKATTASFTPNGTDRYLFIGHMIYDVVGITTQIGFQLIDSVAGVLNSCQQEGEDGTNDFLGHNLFWVGVPTNVARTVAVAPFNSAGAIMLASRVIAINLAKFSQSAGVFDATEVDPAASPTYTTLASVAPTPTATGDWVYIAFGNDDGNEASTSLQNRLQADPDGGGLVSDPNYPADPPQNQWDNVDELPINVFNLLQFTSGGARTVNFDCTRLGGTTARMEDNGLVAFSVALAVEQVQLLNYISRTSANAVYRM